MEKPVCAGATKVEKNWSVRVRQRWRNRSVRVAMRLRLMSLVSVFRLTVHRKLGRLECHMEMIGQRRASRFAKHGDRVFHPDYSARLS